MATRKTPPAKPLIIGSLEYNGIKWRSIHKERLSEGTIQYRCRLCNYSRVLIDSIDPSAHRTIEAYMAYHAERCR